MATTWKNCFLLALLWWLVEGLVDEQEYREGLNLKFLPDGRVLTQFEHVIKWNVDPASLSEDNSDITVRHYGIFPKALAEIVGHYNVQEFHFSLTKGKWRTNQWGYSPMSAPPGAEFWVWFLPNTTDIDHQWNGLINGVSGLMCASLSSVESSSTYSPPSSFRPLGAYLGNLSSSLLRYTAMPREAVCTENLTPWSKLLPCGQKAGIGSLYHALKLYDSQYNSISLHFKPVCQDLECKDVSTELHLTMTVVFEAERKKNKIWWSFKSLFMKTLHSHCPLATDPATVLVDITVHKSGDYTLTPPPNKTVSLYGPTTTQAVYFIHNRTNVNSTLDVSLTLSEKDIQLPITAPPLNVVRYVTGSGLERGGIVTEITNSDPTTPLRALFLDMVPWYLRVLLHTMTAVCTHLDKGGNITSCSTDPVISRKFIPAKDRERPYTTELLLLLPPSSRVTLSFQFLRSFLKWDEYPPDASHGFYVNSAVLTTALPTCLNCSFPVSSVTSDALIQDINDSARLVRIHTESLLVLLPTPDFSMPYNVICFVSTVVAIGFGSIFNLTTKTLKPQDTGDDRRLLHRLLSFFKRKNGNRDEESENKKKD